MTALVVVLTFASHGGRAQRSDERLPRATVHIVVFGPFGSKIHQTEARLRSRDNRLDLTARDDVITDVPYGNYTLSTWDSGGSIAERELAVNAKSIWAYVGLATPTGDRLWPAGELSISGDVHPAPASPDWWGRSEGVFLHASRESPVGQRGQFAIDGLEMGTYLVELFEGSKLRHIETVSIDSNQVDTRLKISLVKR